MDNWIFSIILYNNKMCPPTNTNYMNVLVSAEVGVNALTVRQVISLPFIPKIVRITRLSYACIVVDGSDAILQLKSSFSNDPLTTMVAFIDGSFNHALNDVVKIDQPLQGEQSFTISTVSGVAFPVALGVKYSINLRFED